MRGMRYAISTPRKYANEYQAMEYMVSFQTANQEAGKGEMLRGWYHSYGYPSDR